MKRIYLNLACIAFLSSAMACKDDSFDEHVLVQRGILYSMDSNGENLKKLRSDADVSSPSWQSDGQEIVYSFNLFRSMDFNEILSDIFIMDISTGSHRRIRDGKFDKYVEHKQDWKPNKQELQLYD